MHVEHTVLRRLSHPFAIEGADDSATMLSGTAALKSGT